MLSFKEYIERLEEGKQRLVGYEIMREYVTRFILIAGIALFLFVYVWIAYSIQAVK